MLYFRSRQMQRRNEVLNEAVELMRHRGGGNGGGEGGGCDGGGDGGGGEGAGQGPDAAGGAQHTQLRPGEGVVDDNSTAAACNVAQLSDKNGDLAVVAVGVQRHDQGRGRGGDSGNGVGRDVPLPPP